MEIIMHDLKTERPNVSSGLPGYFRFVPIGFYVGGALAIVLNIFFYLSYQTYKAKEAEWQRLGATAKAEQSKIVAKQTSIQKETEFAQQLAGWIESARPVQPIGVAVGRSMGAEATVAELDLTRNPQIPAHLLMTLKINGSGSQQVESTLDAIGSLNYQTYSAQQVKGPDVIDFQATLIWHAQP